MALMFTLISRSPRSLTFSFRMPAASMSANVPCSTCTDMELSKATRQPVNGSQRQPPASQPPPSTGKVIKSLTRCSHVRLAVLRAPMHRQVASIATNKTKELTPAQDKATNACPNHYKVMPCPAAALWPRT